MGAQTVNANTLYSMNEKAEEAIIGMGGQYMMATRFAVGKKPDLDKFEQIKWLNRILQNKSCHLSCNESQIKETLNKIINC